jgi:hypothetical protein
METERRRGMAMAASGRVPVTLVTARTRPTTPSRLELLKDMAIVVVAGAALTVLIAMLWWTAAA